MKNKINGPELLRGWIGDRSQDYVAKLLGVQPSHLNHWLQRRRIPGLRRAVEIAKLTDGAVPVSSWVGFE